MTTFYQILLFLLLSQLSIFAAKQPNIIFLMTDDQRWDSFGCYGRPEFKTQNIDKLATEGVIFDKAYYAVAICMPSRVTMMTGRYFANHESGFTYPYNREITHEEFKDSYHARLKEAGYRSGFIGKFGFNVVGGQGSLKPYFDYFATHMRWPTDDKKLQEIYRGDRDRRERTLKKGDAMINFLDTQPKGQPFVLSVSFDAVKNDSDQDMYPADFDVFKDQMMTVPGNWVEGDNKKLPEVVQRHWRGFGLHRHYTQTPELYQTLARRFATQGLTVDNQVGRLMKKLEEMGELENTVIIFTSDNGRYHGSHGLFDKAILYEEAMRAPLIIWDGRNAKESKGKRVDALVSSTDMAPTILSIAGVEAPETMQGIDITGLLDGTANREEWRDAVLMESLFLQEIHTAWVHGNKDIPGVNDAIMKGNRSYRCRGVRTDKYKYFRYYEHRPVIEELYDLEFDPLEQNNLVNNPKYQDVLESLRNRTEELHSSVKR